MTQKPDTQPAGNQPASLAPAFLSQYYEIVGVIGEGTFGRVFLATSRAQPGRRLAVKVIKPGKEQEGVCATALREMMLLRAMSHPNILALDSMHMDVKDLSLSLAFDYADHDMYEIIRFHRDLGQPVPIYTIKSLMYQLLQGGHGQEPMTPQAARFIDSCAMVPVYTVKPALQGLLKAQGAGINYMHTNWLLHRDLKPSNILVMGPGEEQGVLKIADFGLTRVFREPLEPLWNNGVVVTIWYRAPELLLDAKHYNPAVDMWATGCIMAELFTLRPVFQGEERKGSQDLFQADQLNKIFTVLGHPSALPGGWRHLDCLRHWRDNTENVRMRRPEHGSLSLAQLLWKTSPLMRWAGRWAGAGTDVASVSGGSRQVPGRGPRRALGHCDGGSPYRQPRYIQPDAALDLMARLLCMDPSRRITAAEALQHPFFQQACTQLPSSCVASDPMPGSNAFVCQGQRMYTYPQRAVRK
ncbi:hypothetical protein N2152v2_008418 [Parachlorella kessleri]